MWRYWGFNAVAVIDVATKTTRGLIPTGWGPARVKLSANEKELYVISCRGLGAGPNGGNGFVAPPQGTYIGDIQLGQFSKNCHAGCGCIGSVYKTGYQQHV